MGCRPSRRAVACVRVAGERPWGSGRSSRPRSITGDSGVRLRHHSSRRSRDEGRSEGGGESNPGDRYSAPPADKQFPPHSCTSAVYEHGCCGTSRITLRLSKNGSTLEIEKCDFQHSVKSCHLCGTAKVQSSDVHCLDTVSLRAQSAPNLSVTNTHSNMPCTPPRFSQHLNKQVVDSEYHHPPPLPIRHMERLSAVVNTKMVSPPGSVCTATKVDVDVESIRHSQPSSSIDNGFHNSTEIYPTKVCTPNKIQTSHDNMRKTRARHEDLATFQKNAAYSQNPKSDAQIDDAQIQSENVDTYSCPYSPSSEDLSKLLRDPESFFINDCAGTETIDLTKLDSTNPATYEDNSDIECLSRLDVHCIKTTVDEDEAGDNSDCSVLVKGNTCPYGNAHSHNAVNGQNIETDDAKTTCYHGHDSDVNSVSTDRKTECQRDRQLICGSTDYRIRMLGAQKCEITSHLADKEEANYHINNTVTQVSDNKMILTSRDGPVLLEENKYGVFKGYRGDHETLAVDANGTSVLNYSQIAPQAGVRCKDDQVVEPVTDMTGKMSKMEHCKEVTDQTSMPDGEGKRTCHLAQLEMTSAYFHTKFENDNIEDLLDDSSPGFDSVC